MRGQLQEPTGSPSRLPSLAPIPDPTVSVVVGTWSDERWADVERVLAAVSAQSRPADELLLVVDGNDELLRRARRAFPEVRSVANAHGRGLSGVRNTGVAASSGDVLVFVDDDAEPEARWLEELLAGYREPDVLGVGGAIHARWDDGRPAWFPPEFDWVVGCTYAGLRLDAGPVRNLIGANMSIRRSVIEALGGFDAQLSKIGDRSRPEDTEFCLRAVSRFPHGRWLYRPGAIVHHRVPARRGSVSYFLARCYHEGRGKAELVSAVGGAGLESERAYTRRTLPRAVVRELRAPARAGTILLGLATATAGYAAGRLLAARPRRPARVLPLERARPARRRILMVCARYLPLTGGAELHVRETARRLAALGHDVTVVTTAPTKRLIGTTHEDGLAVVRLPAWGKRLDLFFAPGIWRIVRRPGWDVVHVQGFHTLTGPLAMLAALTARRDYVVTFHRGVHATALRRRVMALQIRLLRPLIRRASELVCVSGFERALFSGELRLPAERFHVIPNASRLERPAGVTRGPGKLLLSVGRLEPYKGHHRVLEALAHVARERDDVRLRIAGSGPREAALREQARRLGVADRVEIAPVPPDDPQAMARLLVEADLIVALTDYESQSLAVLEAIALRRPLLAHYAGACIEHADAGRIRAVPLGTPSAEVAREVLAVLEQPFEPAGEPLPGWDDVVRMLLGVYGLPAPLRLQAVS